MATALTIINRAMRLIGVKNAKAALHAEEAADAFDVLNALLAEWHEAELRLPDYSFAALETAIASDAGDAEALAYALAERMAPEYGPDAVGATETRAFQKNASESLSRLRLRYFQPGTVSTAELPGESSVYNINTDA